MRPATLDPVRHLLSPNGYLPAVHAKIVWAEDPASGRVRDVAVLPNPLDVPPTLRARLRTMDDPARWPSAHGNCIAGWMNGGGPSHTPKGLFEAWEDSGFASDDERHHALVALGRIAECAWARRMAVEIEEANELEIAAF